jgi:hypothetical protein
LKYNTTIQHQTPMKRLNLVIISVLLVSANLSAYDYQTVYSHRTLFFENSYHSIETILIDSVKLQNDSVIYPAKNLQLVGDRCYSPFGSSWLGSKIIINKQWNYFFNDENDTIKFKTDAALMETWNFYVNAGTTIKATVEKWDTAIVLGVKDSVKTIVLHVFDIAMSPLPHKLDGKTIVISKHFGLIQSVNLLYLPLLKYIPDSNINEEPVLVGMTNPQLGIQNLTWLEAYDFQVGDEFHYTDESNYLMLGGSYEFSKTITKILSRENFNDSIRYLEDIETTITRKENSTADYITSYKHFQSPRVIRQNKVFDINPGVPIFSADSTRVSINDISKSSFQEAYLKNDNCWYRSHIYDDACVSESYSKGRGLIYSGSGCWTTQSFSEYNQVYFKKGSITGGIPLVISGINQPTVKPEIVVYPNPTTNKLSIKKELLTQTCTFEMLDLHGIVVFKTIVDSGTNSISIDFLNNGIYTYRLIKDTEIIKTGRIIKI